MKGNGIGNLNNNGAIFFQSTTPKIRKGLKPSECNIWNSGLLRTFAQPQYYRLLLLLLKFTPCTIKCYKINIHDQVHIYLEKGK